MKKIILFIVLSLVLSVPCFGQESVDLLTAKMENLNLRLEVLKRDTWVQEAYRLSQEMQQTQQKIEALKKAEVEKAKKEKK